MLTIGREQAPSEPTNCKISSRTQLVLFGQLSTPCLIAGRSALEPEKFLDQEHNVLIEREGENLGMEVHGS